MRKHLLFASLIVSLFVLGGCSADDTTARGAHDSAKAGIAAGSKDGGNCKAYVAAVRQVCLDSITRRLDVSCDHQLMALEMVQEQFAGTLFDVGSDTKNAEVAEAACDSYLGSLQKKRKSKDAGMQAGSDTGPNCAAFAGKFEVTCLRDLGQQPLPDKCRSATRMLSGAARLSAEDLCAMAERQME